MKGNVLLVSNYSSETGYAWWLMEFFWITISKYVNSSQKTFLAYPKVNEISENIYNSDIQTVALNFDLLIKATRNSILSFIKNNKITTIYFTDRKYFDTNYRFLRTAGVKIIIIHDHTPGDRPEIKGLKGIFKAWRNKIGLFTADAFLNVSPLMRQRSIKNGGIPENKCFSIQNGIKTLEPKQSNFTHSIREELGINKNAVVVVTSSRLHSYKRVDQAIKAFETATHRIEMEIHLLVVGDGPDEERLRDVASKCTSHKKIHFLGFRRDIKNILNESDLAIHCSQGEGFSLSIVEYMAACLPVIVPNIPSVCQAITHDKNGFIYRNNHLPEASNFIKKLSENTELRKKMGSDARSKVYSDFKLEHTLQQFEAVLSGLGI